jgi:hypothetical protein
MVTVPAASIVAVDARRCAGSHQERRGKQEKQVRRRGEGGGVGAARFQLLRRGDGLRAEMWSRRW